MMAERCKRQPAAMPKQAVEKTEGKQPSMTITQMQYFAMVCRFQSISKAAEQLFVSQPALSASLADLEREVGFKLFERRSRGVVPTEEGRLMLGHVTAVLRRYELLQRSIPELAEHQNILHVGFRPTSGENEFLDVFKKYRQIHPEVRLRVNEMSNDTPWIYLEDGMVDFLVCAPTSMPVGWESKYQHRQVGTGKMKLYCSKESPLAQKEIVTYKDLDNMPMVFWEGSKAAMRNISDVFEANGVNLNVVAVVPQITGVLNLICSNIGIGILNGSFLKSLPMLHEVPLDPNMDFASITKPPQIHMFWKKQIENYQVKKDFIDFVKKYSTELDE